MKKPPMSIKNWSNWLTLLDKTLNWTVHKFSKDSRIFYISFWWEVVYKYLFFLIKNFFLLRQYSVIRQTLDIRHKQKARYLVSGKKRIQSNLKIYINNNQCLSNCAGSVSAPTNQPVLPGPTRKVNNRHLWLVVCKTICALIGWMRYNT